MDLFAEKLQNNILSRQKDDKPLIKYRFLVFLFLLLFGSIVTWQVFYELGTTSVEAPILLTMIFNIFLFGVLLLRFQKVNNFIKRKQSWYCDITAFTKEHSSHQADCNTLETLSQKTFHQIKSIPIKLYLINCSISLAMSGFSNFLSANYLLEYLTITFILMIINLIFVGIPINIIWNRLQNFEYQFDQQLSIIWKKEHWIENDIDFIVDPQKDRNFILWTFFSFISFGIMLIIWDYKIHTDPDNLYPQFHKIEDDLLSHIDTIENNKDIRPVL